MWARLRASMVRRIPALRWRDVKLARLERALTAERKQARSLTARVAELEAAATTQERAAVTEIASLKRRVDELIAEIAGAEERSTKAAVRSRALERRPSFLRQIVSVRNSITVVNRTDPASRTALRQLPYKLRNYSVAQSHHVQTPSVFETWCDVADLALGRLPDRFVIKSDGGSGSHDVYPMVRVGDDQYRAAGHQGELSEAELKAEFADLLSRRKARYPIFAEEFLDASRPAGDVPPDIKIFAFYGEIGHVMLRSVANHGDHKSFRFRFLMEDGADLGNVSIGPHIVDPGLELPDRFEELLDAARHLSRAVGTPFVRVDLYDTPNGPVLGELTRSPGNHVRYRPDHDRRLGLQWLEAQTRLEQDLADGRPPGVIFGDVSPRMYYPSGDSNDSSGPGAWPVNQFACSRWCG